MENVPIPAVSVLAPFDGSSAAATALSHIAWLAAENGEVHLLEVLPEPAPILDVLGETLVSAEEVDRLSREGAERKIGTAAEQLKHLNPSLRCRHMVAHGDPAESIVAAAVRTGANLIALTSLGHGSRPGSIGIGSVALRVARTSPVPVLLARPRPEAPGPIRRLVVPLDGSEASERTLPVVAALARLLDLPVLLVHVVDLAETLVPSLDYDAAIGTKRLGELVADARNDAELLVERHGAHLLRQGLTASWDVREGQVAPTLLGMLHHADLLVISSHGRSSGNRWPLGSVAEKLVRSGETDVLMLRLAAAAVTDPTVAEMAAAMGGER